MTELVIACEMLEDEIREAMRQTGRDLPISWIDRGLHEYPERLREMLLTRIKEAGDVDVIMLTFALCGGALSGIYSERAKLVIPLFDDCIHMLKSPCTGNRGEVDCRTLYFTGGWLKSERFIYKDYLKCCERYGKKTAQRVYREILKNYRTFELMDTQSYALEAFLPQAETAADELKLTLETGTGSLRVLKKLFSGDWDEEFLVVQPGERITMEQFIFAGRQAQPDADTVQASAQNNET
ncbi:MAG: DUF1638 domain-containing protein [Bacillota bacterium]